METVNNKDKVPEERKSAKYKNFPDAGFGVWGPEVREKHPDRLHEAIMARIKHISGRLDQYLPPYDQHYKVDQSLALDLENSFDELAQLYLKISKEGQGGYLEPIEEDGHYSYEPMKALDGKLEEVHELIINAEKPFFDEERGKILIDKEGNPVEGTVGDGYKELSASEKRTLHERGIGMLTNAVEKIKNLKQILTSRPHLIS